MFIETKELTKTFRTDAGEIQVLKGINISIAEGEMVGVVGASGVGKSTLLHILGILDNPTSGKVLYNAADVFSLDRNSLASFRNKTVGFVFQFHHLMPEFTALENVMMPGLIRLSHQSNGGSYTDIQKKAGDILGQLGLKDRIKHRPGELSGGEQQRVAVARALLLDPRVVLADEPTGNLDTVTGEELFKIFLDLNKQKGITFIIVTHNESLSSRCSRVLKMRDGNLE
ncbi:MAG: ABC transporter ATP-binding protein [Thermodesulfovibrionales bacterium]|jgi:lipoprotein-releasing system ATP-binding protein